MCDSEEFTEEQKAAQQLAERIRGVGGLRIKTHRILFKTYKLSFRGKNLVDWLVNNGYATSRAEATQIGQRLVDHHLIHHVTDTAQFKDDKLLYRYRADDNKPEEGPSATGLIAACNGVTAFGPLLLKTRPDKKKWSPRFCVLKASELKLYVYMMETDPSPEMTFLLDDDTIVTEGKDKAGNSCLVLKIQDVAYYWKPEVDAERASWIQSFADAGARVGTGKEWQSTDNYKSVFDFVCTDIDGAEVKLSTFQGMVTMIVNVACE